MSNKLLLTKELQRQLVEEIKSSGKIKSSIFKKIEDGAIKLTEAKWDKLIKFALDLRAYDLLEEIRLFGIIHRI